MTQSAFWRLENALSLLSVFALAGSLYIEYGLGFLPCPLCLMQRLCLIVLVICGVMGPWVRKGKKTAFSLRIMELFFAAAGLFFASRQLWLQSVAPPEVSTCLPGLEMLLRYFPWQELVHVFLWGSSNCGELTWHWMGFSMPVWSGLYFALFFLAKGLLLVWLSFVPLFRQHS